MAKLSDYAFNEFSQFGEDGIIAKALELLKADSRVCIEFGAWDGLHFSNTTRLWRQGWKAILIEADPNRFASLVENTGGYDCRCIAAKVGYQGSRTLEALLARHVPEVDPGAIDLLSIDIDGDDYLVLRSMSKLRPRLLLCEYNPTIPVDIELVPEESSGFGCSALSLVKLAESKGYKLIAMSDTNCFFVGSSDFARFAGFETRLEALFDPCHLTYLMSGYDGSYVLSQSPVYGISRPSTAKLAGKHFVPRWEGWVWRLLRRARRALAIPRMRAR